MSRGYFGIGVYHCDKKVNIGTLWRHAQAFGAAFMFTIGRRYEVQASDTTKSWRHLPMFHYRDADSFLAHRPRDCRLVAVENTGSTHVLQGFEHPERAIYLLGNEGSGLPSELMERSAAVVEIPANFCLNVSVSGSVAMYDRTVKRGLRTRMDSGGDGYRLPCAKVLEVREQVECGETTAA